MALNYDQAVAALFQSPLDTFVAERKRLASELKTAGDKAGSARLLRLTRPPISAWVVNQLWWRERALFERLFASAERLRAGDRSASEAHRDVSARLRAQAAELLSAAGHGATEATLRRVSMTLAALAAIGNFEPDSAGALTSDRDAPGFGVFAGGAPPEPAREPRPAADGDRRERERLHEEQRKQQAAEEEQRRREAEERKRRAADREQRRQRAAAALASARAELARREHEIERVRHELERVEQALADAREQAKRAQRELEAVEAEPDNS